MRFTPKEDIKHGQLVLEEGTTYTAEKQGISESEIRAYHALGVVDIEGEETPVRVTTGGATIQPQKSVIGSSSTEA